MGSRPASMDYGRRDMPLQGIAEHHGEGVGAHPVTFDSGSDIGSEMGSRPGSQPASPRGRAWVSHLVCFHNFQHSDALLQNIVVASSTALDP